jgi:hypothetical protein
MRLEVVSDQSTATRRTSQGPRLPLGARASFVLGRGGAGILEPPEPEITVDELGRRRHVDVVDPKLCRASRLGFEVWSSYFFFKVKSPVARGQLAHVVAQGRTGLCRITVSKGGIQMQLGPSPRVNPLRPKLSGALSDGRVAWEWWVPTDTPLGLWRVRVNCGRAAALQGTFVVLAR